MIRYNLIVFFKKKNRSAIKVRHFKFKSEIYQLSFIKLKILEIKFNTLNLNLKYTVKFYQNWKHWR